MRLDDMSGTGEREGRDEEEEEDAREAMRLMPSYPFPAEFRLEYDGGPGIEVISHTCRDHPKGTRVVTVFCPGVHGGVGPCRNPGDNFDENALYATVVQRLMDLDGVAVDCYRCSWPFMRPRLGHAIGGVCRVLHHGLQEAIKDRDMDREVNVVFVGHSLGGAVVTHAGQAVARHFREDGAGGQDMPGFERARVRMAGIVTLNGAVHVEDFEDAHLQSLSSCRALLVSGDADQVVPPESTASLFEALPMPRKRHLCLEGGTHDLYAHKEQLVEELVQFISDCQDV